MNTYDFNVDWHDINVVMFLVSLLSAENVRLQIYKWANVESGSNVTEREGGRDQKSVKRCNIIFEQPLI